MEYQVPLKETRILIDLLGVMIYPWQKYDDVAIAYRYMEPEERDAFLTKLLLLNPARPEDRVLGRRTIREALHDRL